MAGSHVIDTFGPVELLREMSDMFGTRRMVEVLGWSLLIGATLKPGDRSTDVRDRLVAMGFSRAAAYRAIADIKLLVHRLEVLRGPTVSMSSVLAEINSLDTSRMGDFVVK